METRCYGCMRIKQSSPECEHCGFDERSRNNKHQLPIGTEVGGQYILGRVLGQGGFGITYIAWDKVLNQRVAVKEYFPSGYAGRDTHDHTVTSYDDADQHTFDSNKRRFLREAESLAKLWNIPQIVKILRCFEENGTAYIAMEYVEGMDLRRYLKQLGRPMTMDEVLAILGPVMEALEQVHKANLVHRDISPDNIMVLPDGSAKLLDFGAARYVENADAEQDRNTSTQAILKHGFAPPEQYRSHGALGPWTDVYALCATVYFCLTGKIPPESMSRMMGEADLNLHSVTGITGQQRTALENGMNLTPKLRIQSVQTLYQQLFEQTPSHRNATQQKQPPLKKKKGKPFALISASVVLAVVAAGFFMMGTLDNTELAVPAVAQTTADTSVETTVAEETDAATMVPEPTEALWRDNVMMNMYDTLGVFWGKLYQVPIDSIVEVIFLDTLSDAPGYAWDVSADGNRSVRAWTAPAERDMVTMYIAGEGGVNGVQASDGLFRGLTGLERVRFGGNFHTEDTTSMWSMFLDCKNLKYVDLNSLDTSNVKNMSYMFYGCSGLTKLDLSTFDTSNVKNMTEMFFDCSGLTELNLTSFDTSNVTNMSRMFYGCFRLRELDLSSFDTSSVTDMSWMFNDCSSLINLDLSSFDTSSVTDMSWMFNGCSNLINLDLSSFETSTVTNMSYMFNGCNNLPASVKSITIR